jgi:hypothetical protein
MRATHENGRRKKPTERNATQPAPRTLAAAYASRQFASVSCREVSVTYPRERWIDLAVRCQSIFTLDRLPRPRIALCAFRLFSLFWPHPFASQPSFSQLAACPHLAASSLLLASPLLHFSSLRLFSPGVEPLVSPSQLFSSLRLLSSCLSVSSPLVSPSPLVFSGRSHPPALRPASACP